MHYYRLLKLNTLIKSTRLKLFGLFLLHLFKRRYLGVYFDPINACNLRCKMCYFTDEVYIKNLKGMVKKEELPLWGKAILSRALKLQVGCGTEPTLYKDLDTIFKIARAYKVPYIAMTTNANLIEKEPLAQWIQSGLHEITVSLHGVCQPTYEEFMGKGDYQKLRQALQSITELKKTYPNFKLRINYTFNEANFDELAHFWEVFHPYAIDILQLRPINKIGNTTYQNFSSVKIIPNFEELILKLKTTAKQRKVQVLAPTLTQLKSQTHASSALHAFTYCYSSPTFFWRKDFNWRTETFDAYATRTHWSYQLLKQCFVSNKSLKKLENTSLNYTID